MNTRECQPFCLFVFLLVFCALQSLFIFVHAITNAPWAITTWTARAVKRLTAVVLFSAVFSIWIMFVETHAILLCRSITYCSMECQALFLMAVSGHPIRQIQFKRRQRIAIEQAEIINFFKSGLIKVELCAATPPAIRVHFSD